MTWFIFALVCLMSWGLADLFYKKSNVDGDRYSHLRTAVWVGMVMGVCAFLLMPLAQTKMSLPTLVSNAVKYSPASLCYIISMVIGYAGMRYLELSIVSPVQNASGALSAVCMFIYFSVIGSIGGFWDEFSVLDVIGTVIIVIAVIALAVVEQRLAKAESGIPKEDRKYRFGALALIFPILYCIFDTIGTAADGIILDEDAGLGLGEIDVIILYGLTFMIAGIVAWIFLWIKERKPYNPFAVSELRTKGIAAVCEEIGQVFYVYAMASKPMLAAPMVGSYCIVSVILSHLFLKEKLRAGQYACVVSVIVGIVILGISEGLAEA